MQLQMNGTTWLYFIGVVLLWVISGMLAGDRRARSIFKWKTILLSLFGSAWIYFGVIYIFRFLALLYDPVLFNTTLFPMWEIPDDTLSKIFLYLGVYWSIFCLGMVITKMAVPRRLPRFLKRLNLIEAPANFSSLDVLMGICIFSIFLVNGPWSLIPYWLLTPIGIISSLWVIPPTIAWYFHFRGLRISLKRRLLYLVPGILVFLLNPYREYLLSAVLCVLVPFLLIKPRVKLLRIIGLGIVFLLIASVLIYVYRPMLWEGESYQEARKYVSWEEWQEKPYQAPWIRLVNRFSGFDASALTVLLVPGFFPYENRNILTELVGTAFMPRAIFWEKSIAERGRDFSTSIWAYAQSGQVLKRESSPIAPSMFGDLWASGGLETVILGASIWGILIGVLECWRKALTPGAGVVLIVFLATRIGGGMERDFVHTAATVIQGVIVLLIFVVFLRGKTVRVTSRTPVPRFENRIPYPQQVQERVTSHNLSVPPLIQEKRDDN